MLHNIVQGLANAQIANIMTIVFVALMFISVIWGILRGLKKSIFYTIFYVIACAILFLSLDKIASLALSFDISWLGYSINGVKLVTLGDSVPELLRSILSQGNSADLSTMFVKGTESYVLVNTVLGSIVQFAVVLAFVLLFQTVYKLLVWILWLIIGKRFDKRKVRVKGKLIKKPKNATGGALVGFIPGLISVVMLFVPISGVFSIAQSITKAEVKNGVSFGDYLDESDYYLLQQVLGQYEESFPGKLFNIKTSEDGRSLDLWLLDKCITVEVDGNKFNIREDIENLGQFASNMAATGLLDVMLDGDATTYDLVNAVNENEDKITKAFSSLGNIELIDLLLNTGIEYLDCSRIIDTTLELSSDSINYENLAKLDWSKELAQIGNIFISAVDILSLVPDSNLSSPTIELDKIDLDKLNNEGILENFVNELFESNIINESATAGLAYVLGIDNVKEIVGEVDKEKLKNVDLKADLLRVVEATKSILNIGLDSFTNVNLQELANKSSHLKTIVDELLSMEIFTLVEENVIDYAITNYVENNENIKKFVDVEELRELRLVDFKRELGAVIDTFGRLGEETKLFELDGSENILMDKLNMDAFNSYALRIIVDHIDSSTTIQDFMDDILRGALVPNIFDEEKYNDLITKENFVWSNELYVLVDLLKEIETNNNDFNIYVMATSDEKEITVGMLKGLYGVDENNEYIIDKSIFVEELMLSIINKATEGNDFEGTFDEVDSLGIELEALTEMMIDAGIVEDRNDYVVDFASISNDFDGINLKMLRSISTHIGESNILRSIINTKITDFKVNDKEVIDTTGWDANKYTEEFTVLYEVLEASGKVDEEEKTPFNELGNLFSDSIPLTMLEEVSNEVGHSEILQNTMKIALEEQFTNTDFDGWSNEDWTNETTSLYNIINDGELYTVDSEGDKVVDLNEVSNTEDIKLVTIKSFSENINDSTLIQDLMKDELKSVMGDDYDFTPWRENRTWGNEMTALYEVSKTISTIKDDKEVVDLNEFDSMTKIKVSTIDACRDNVSESEMIQKIMKDNLSSIMGENYDYSLWDGSKWESELSSLSDISYTLQNDGEIDLDGELVGDKVKIETISSLSANSNSDIVRNCMKDTIDDMIKIENSPEKSCMPIYNEYNVMTYKGWDDNQWKYELSVLEVISIELQDNDGYLDTTNISENLKELKVSFLGVIVDLIYGNLNGNKYNSYILQAQLVEPVESMMNSNGDNPNYRKLHPVNGVDYNYVDDRTDLTNIHIQNVPEYNDYDFSLDDEVGKWWQKELGALYLLAADKFGFTGSIPTEDFNFDGDTKVSTINVIRKNIANSYVLQSCMRKVIDDVMNQDRSAYPSYEKYECENWTPINWYTEITAIRNAAKTLASTSLTIANSLINPDNYIAPSWIIEDQDDDKFFFNLSSIEIEDSSGVSIHTLYYLSIHAKDSVVIRSLLRVHLAEILGDISDDSFVNEWLGNSGINDGINSYVNRWEYEMEAFFNITCHLVNNENKVELGTTMFNELPVGVFDVLNGAFKNHTIDTSKITLDHGYVSDYNGNKYHSELVRSLLLDALPSSVQVDPSTWANVDNQWAYEMYAISTIANEFASHGKVDFNNISFDDGNGNTIIKISVLDVLSNLIHYSTFMQEKLCDTLFADSSTKDTSKYPELEYLNPNNDNTQWNNEIRALYAVISGTSYVNSNGEFNPDDLNFDTNVDAKILENIGNNIQYSTYLQSELESTIEGLVGEFDSSRMDIVDDYGLTLSSSNYIFDLSVNYGDSNFAWRTELKTIFGIILDDESGLVHTDFNGNKYVVINEIKDDLNNLKINLLEIASKKLEEYSYLSYGSSKVVRLNLVLPLEELSNFLIGVTHSSTEFKWTKIIDGSNVVPSDLKDLADFFEIIGADNIEEADLLLDDISNLEYHKYEIKELDARSYYIHNMLINNGFDFSLVL